jgi:AAA15 family ATPase/GTPase
MLLEFKTKNFKSFADETTFTMLAAPKQKGLDYSLCAVKNSRTSQRVVLLCHLWSQRSRKNEYHLCDGCP